MLCWYDESASWLGTATAGLARFCDHIVAVDGAYALYPDSKARSHPNQAEAIVHTAEAQGVAVTLHQPADVWWGNEVEKRNKSLDIVRAYAEEGEDWLCIFDADYHIKVCQPDSIRHELSTTDCDVATYGIVEGEDWLALENPLATETSIKTEWVTKTRDLYRVNATLKCGPAHGDYSIQMFPFAGVKKWLRGPYDLAHAHDVSGFLTAYHRTKDRAMVRRTAQKGYYQMRDSLEVEAQ